MNAFFRCFSVLGTAALATWANGAEATMHRAAHELIPVAVTNGRTMDVELADLDADGDLDLVIATEFGQNVVLLREGRRFVHAVDAIPQGPAHDSADIAIADLDGDGDLDLVIASEDDQVNECYLNRGDGSFDDASDRIVTEGTSNAVIAFDADADGDQDLFFGNKGQNVLLLNDGGARFSDVTVTHVPAFVDTTQDLEAADIDGDGDLDVVVANEDANRLLVNDGTGHFTDETAERLGIRDREETREADFGDLDGDGDVDLVFGNVGWFGGDPRDVVLLNDGTGRFASPSDPLPARSVFTLDVDVVDFDGDGDLDVVTAEFPESWDRPCGIYLNDGHARFRDAAEEIFPSGLRGRGIDVEVLDLDGDGRMDVYVANHASSDFILVH